MRLQVETGLTINSYEGILYIVTNFFKKENIEFLKEFLVFHFSGKYAKQNHSFCLEPVLYNCLTGQYETIQNIQIYLNTKQKFTCLKDGMYFFECHQRSIISKTPIKLDQNIFLNKKVPFLPSFQKKPIHFFFNIRTPYFKFSSL